MLSSLGSGPTRCGLFVAHFFFLCACLPKLKPRFRLDIWNRQLEPLRCWSKRPRTNFIDKATHWPFKIVVRRAIASIPTPTLLDTSYVRELCKFVRTEPQNCSLDYADVWIVNRRLPYLFTRAEPLALPSCNHRFVDRKPSALCPSNLPLPPLILQPQ